MNNYALVQNLIEKYGKGISAASIGIAGERMYKNATVQVMEFGTNYPQSRGSQGRGRCRHGL